MFVIPAQIPQIFQLSQKVILIADKIRIHGIFFKEKKL